MKVKFFVILIFSSIFLLFGCSNEKIDSKTFNVKEDDFELIFTILEEGEQVKVTTSLKNASEKSFHITYGLDVVHLELDQKPLQDAYRMPAFTGIVSTSFDFKPILVEKNKWRKAKEITAKVRFDLNGNEVLKVVQLK